MKFISVLGFLLFAATSHAQDLDRRPDAPKTNNLTAPSATGSLVQDLIFPNTPIPDGMVWVPRGKVWHAEELNSCAWCTKPMTFRHAVFDRKMSSMWLLTRHLPSALFRGLDNSNLFFIFSVFFFGSYELRLLILRINLKSVRRKFSLPAQHHLVMFVYYCCQPPPSA
jgi:hypothetical protein